MRLTIGLEPASGYAAIVIHSFFHAVQLQRPHHGNDSNCSNHQRGMVTHISLHGGGGIIVRHAQVSLAAVRHRALEHHLNATEFGSRINKANQGARENRLTVV